MECIRAVIPAAGLSSRMGDFKPLLMLHGRTLIENCVSNLLEGGAETVTVVTGYRADEIENTLSSSFGRSVFFIRNDNYARTDMLHSIKLGVSILKPCNAFFLLPGDMPMVSSRTCSALIKMRAHYPSPVIFPVFNGHRKHPPLIDAKLIPVICSFNGAGGLRELWKCYEKEMTIVQVDDPGTDIDIDTPEDYLYCLNRSAGSINGID